MEKPLYGTRRGPRGTPAGTTGRRRPGRVPGRVPGRRGRVRHRLRRFLLRSGFLVVALGALPSVSDLALGLRGGGEDCRVVSVVDGDTVGLWCAQTGSIRGRLVGFDAPEKFSPECTRELAQAVAATWALRRALWSAEEVTVRRQGNDRYGRALVDLRTDGVPVGQTLIAAGLARPYEGGRRAGWCD